MQGDQAQNIHTPRAYTAGPLTDTAAHPTRTALSLSPNFQESDEILKYLAKEATSTFSTKSWCSTKSLWK